jgi:hypothetical protein
MSVVEVACQAGHAPTMTLAMFAHLIADLDGGDRLSAEAAIRSAREAEVSGKCPPPATPGGSEVELLDRHGRSRTRTWDLFLIRDTRD